MDKPKIKVLVVDDSAFMRKAISNMISSDPVLDVIGTARDGQDAIQKIEELKPDIVTLDVEMPRMDGLSALKIIMEKMPLPVLMLSSLTMEGTKATIEALSIGAADFVPKNLDNLSLNIVKVKEELVAKIKAIAGKKVEFEKTGSQPNTLSQPLAAQKPAPKPPPSLIAPHRRASIVAIGASTGGPKALQDVLTRLPKDFPVGITIVQHMPQSFIRPFADRLNQLCKIEVKTAEDGEKVRPGVAYIAPGNYHLTFKRIHSADVRIKLSTEPSDGLHRPSIDQMMYSVAEVYMGSSIGVILTGMGHDGREGMKAVKEADGRIIAQDERSCVVFGMSRAVIELGIADKIIPLRNLVGELINMV